MMKKLFFFHDEEDDGGMLTKKEQKLSSFASQANLTHRTKRRPCISRRVDLKIIAINKTYTRRRHTIGSNKGC